MTASLRAVLRMIVRVFRVPGLFIITILDGLKAENGVGPLNRFQRGAVHTFIWVCALIVFSVVIHPTLRSSPATTTTTAAATTTTTTRTAPSTTSIPVSVPAAVERGPATDWDEVNRVIDGDTFVLVDGRHVRLLGIDSCETSGADASPGGADATAEAQRLMSDSGWRVKLTAQPGAPDVDRYGRLLRYAELTTGDYGVAMVGYDHTGIYQGKNDASAAYLGELYSHDLDHAANPPSGRECGEFPPPVTTTDDGGGVYVPLPDNDDDHHKSRFCRRHWFC